MSSGSEFDRDVFALQPSSVQYSPLATTLPLPTTLQKKHGNIAENIINLFTTGDSTTRAQDEALLQSHMPYVNDTGVVPSSLESQPTSAGKITVLTKTLSTTPVLAFHLIDNSTLLASYEIGAAYGVLPSKAAPPVTKPFSSALTEFCYRRRCQFWKLARIS